MCGNVLHNNARIVKRDGIAVGRVGNVLARVVLPSMPFIVAKGIVQVVIAGPRFARFAINPGDVEAACLIKEYVVEIGIARGAVFPRGVGAFFAKEASGGDGPSGLVGIVFGQNRVATATAACAVDEK